ncbi:MAG TPA: hypothetical protein VE781_14635, partial [Kineosporiaceae bacterium]|nr:hypothetical protein [Kineosporiaceae bacterium]
LALTPACSAGRPADSAAGLPASWTPVPSSTAPVASGSAAPSASPSPGAAPGAAAPARELPRGGRVLFPKYRLVGYSGAPGSKAFGRLGIGDLDARVTEIEKLARGYRAGREPLPVLELIAVVVQRYPGRDGMYRVRMGDDVIGQYLAAARRHKALLLLNIQPGRARFVDEVRAMSRWLKEPDVGVALDPEWAVKPGQTPGRVFGSTTGAVVDDVSAYLDGVVTANALPQKALVVHQLNPQIVTGWQALRRRSGVAVVKSVDGIGSAGAKVSTWKRLVKGLPPTLHPGFKLFFDEDTEGGLRLMTPPEVLALKPQPEYVLYE